MRKLWGGALLLLALSIPFQFCRKGNTVERTIENGVEVVVNHLEPYKLPGVPSNLKLEEILSIDMEKDEIAKMGLASVETFTVDSAGSIYIMQRQSSDKFIFKFDSAGKFLTSFGRKGQGPGEFDYGGNILIGVDDLLIAKDMSEPKFFVLSTDGALIKEVKLAKNISFAKYLGDKRYLTCSQEQDPKDPVFRNYYFISNDTLSENNELFHFDFEDSTRAPRYSPVHEWYVLGASAGSIFIGNAEKGYEIMVFNIDGKLLRKIRKAFRPVPVSEEFKTGYKKMLERRGGQGLERLRKLYFPAHMPAFRYLFTDEQSRLYVMTNERAGERKYWYDIFTAEGLFIGRFQLDNVEVTSSQGAGYRDDPLDAMVLGDRLYCLREKDSGFKMLTVYRMRWS